MTAEKYPHRKYPVLVLAVLMVALCAACGAKLVRGEAPMVRMNELSHQDNNISLQLSIRNVNGVPLDILNIDLSVSVNDSELFAYAGPVDTSIIGNSTETWSVDVTESSASRELLDSLQNGDVKSLPYTLEGKITTEGDGTLRFEHEGHLYTLPGRPGHFR